MIRLEGCLNFRDLGVYRNRSGRPLRPGVLYRSDALHQLTPADLRRVRDELGVREIIDLRSTAEVRADGIGPLAAPPVRYHHLPIYDGERSSAAESAEIPEGLGHRYQLMLRFARPRIGEILERLSSSEHPAVFHCAAGKDRTGVIAAILLGIADVDEPLIVADYAATASNIDAIVARLRASEGYRHILDELPPDTLHAHPATMIDLLARLRNEWGSLAGYARATGLAEASIARLRARLVGTDEA